MKRSLSPAGFRALRATFLGLVAIIGSCALTQLFLHPPPAVTGGEDFDAFYCGARALASRQDPYLYGSLRPCEIEHVKFDIPSGVVPAPLPPYALAAFVPLARLPFPQASFVWWVLLLLSTLSLIWAIVELTSLPLWLVGASIVPAVLLQALSSRALTPLPIAFLCASAVAISRSKWNAAAMLLGLAYIEPHLALPPTIAAFVLLPRLRVRLAIVICSIALISLVSGGWTLNLEYLTAVIPAQARSEIGFPGQYSLSFVLHAFGVPENAAIAFGSVQYVLFVIAGVFLANALRRSRPESIVLVPMALAVTGGAYIHLSQVAAILPLAFVIASRYRSVIAWFGVALISVPWQSLLPIQVSSIHSPPAADSELAEVAWKALAGQVQPSWFSWLAHALTYLGMALVLWSVFDAARRSGQPRGAPVVLPGS